MKQALIRAAIATAMLVPTVGTASAVTINFDNLADGTVLSTQYAAQGVTFVANAFTGAGSSTSLQPWATNTSMVVTSTDLGGLGTPSLASGNLLHAFGSTYTGWLSENGDPSFFMNFSTAISSISVTFAGVSTGPDTRIFAYNGNTLLATIAGPTTTTGQFTLSYSAASITRVAVAAGSYNDWVGVDNVVFTQVGATPAVPEPATWAMMLVGFGGMGAAMRYRRRKQSVSFA